MNGASIKNDLYSFLNIVYIVNTISFLKLKAFITNEL